MFGLLVRAGYKVEGGAPASHTHNHVHHAGMSNWDVVHAWGWKGVMCAAMRWCSTMAGPNHSHTAHPFFQPVELCRSLSSSVDCPVIDLLHGISDFLHLPRPPAWHGRRASVLSPKRTAVRYGDNDTSSWSDWYTVHPSHFTIAKEGANCMHSQFYLSTCNKHTISTSDWYRTLAASIVAHLDICIQTLFWRQSLPLFLQTNRMVVGSHGLSRESSFWR